MGGHGQDFKSQDKEKWWAVETAMMQCSAPWDVANVLTAYGNISFSRTLVLGVILILTFNQHQSLTFFPVTDQNCLSISDLSMSATCPTHLLLNLIILKVNIRKSNYRIFRPITHALSIQKRCKIVKMNMRGIR
jgi:hypothetical protein